MKRIEYMTYKIKRWWRYSVYSRFRDLIGRPLPMARTRLIDNFGLVIKAFKVGDIVGFRPGVEYHDGYGGLAFIAQVVKDNADGTVKLRIPGCSAKHNMQKRDLYLISRPPDVT